MNVSDYLPNPEAIPAPAWLFLVLGNVLFAVHILLINIVVGGCLLALFFPGKTDRDPRRQRTRILASQIPLILPFGITVGVAPLLFMQVVFGHLFYTSSILMAVYWILVIPCLILAYYGIYIHARQIDHAPRLARLALGIATVFFLYIGFIYVNNLTLMARPDRWVDYFAQRGGTLLNLSDPTLIPRYLHFVTASVAVAALALAVLWDRQFRQGIAAAGPQRMSCLRWFAGATVVQMLVGLWFLGSQPPAIREYFLGGGHIKTAVLAIGVLAGIGAVVSGMRGKLRPTLVQLAITFAAMILTRHQLRAATLKPYFSPNQLIVVPQLTMLVLFLVILAVGLVCVVYLIHVSRTQTVKGGTP